MVIPQTQPIQFAAQGISLSLNLAFGIKRNQEDTGQLLGKNSRTLA